MLETKIQVISLVLSTFLNIASKPVEINITDDVLFKWWLHARQVSNINPFTCDVISLVISFQTISLKTDDDGWHSWNRIFKASMAPEISPDISGINAWSVLSLYLLSVFRFWDGVVGRLFQYPFGIFQTSFVQY